MIETFSQQVYPYSVAYLLNLTGGRISEMPSKNKRAALRQAKLSQRGRRRGGTRRRRNAGQIEDSPSTPVVASGRNRAATAATAQTPTASVAATSDTSARRTPTVAAAPSARTRTRTARNRATGYQPLPMYAYLGSELKRIGAITVVMAVALAALTVALG